MVALFPPEGDSKERPTLSVRGSLLVLRLNGDDHALALRGAEGDPVEKYWDYWSKKASPTVKRAFAELTQLLLHRRNATIVLERLARDVSAEDLERSFATLMALARVADTSGQPSSQAQAGKLLLEYELRFQSVVLLRSVPELIRMLDWLSEDGRFADLWELRGSSLEDDIAHTAWARLDGRLPLGIQVASLDPSWPREVADWFKDRLRLGHVVRTWRRLGHWIEQAQLVRDDQRRLEETGDAWAGAQLIRNELGVLKHLPRARSSSVRLRHVVSWSILLAGVIAVAVPLINPDGIYRLCPDTRVQWLTALSASALATCVSVRLVPRSWVVAIIVAALGGSALGIPPSLREILIGSRPALALLISIGLNVLFLALGPMRRSARAPASAQILNAALVAAGVTALPAMWLATYMSVVQQKTFYCSFWPWIITWSFCQATVHGFRLNASADPQTRPPPKIRPRPDRPSDE
jgi:hypothetical protein